VNLVRDWRQQLEHINGLQKKSIKKTVDEALRWGQGHRGWSRWVFVGCRFRCKCQSKWVWAAGTKAVPLRRRSGGGR